tara:strand:- start:556 stop:1191 length:636 start_codon:yes stop_codon:yes gene_type:complete
LEPGAIDALRRESEQWRRDLGYFRQDEKTVYDGYSDVALQQLAGQGDLLAYSVMYDRMIDAGGYSDRSRLKALLTDWAAAGSTRALMALAKVEFFAALESGSDHGVTNDVLAIYDVALKRGDVRAVMYMDQKASLRKRALTLSDVEDVRAKSEQLYARLKARRRELGMGGFVNAKPESLELLYAKSIAHAVSAPGLGELVGSHVKVPPCPS